MKVGEWHYILADCNDIDVHFEIVFSNYICGEDISCFVDSDDVGTVFTTASISLPLTPSWVCLTETTSSFAMESADARL